MNHGHDHDETLWQGRQRDRIQERDQQAHNDRRQHRKRSATQWRKNKRQPSVQA